MFPLKHLARKELTNEVAIVHTSQQLIICHDMWKIAT